MKAIIMAGGEGTRLRPITGEIPKPMVKICDRPVLYHIIELLKKNGITDICITLRYLPEKIKSYFGSGDSLGVKITYSEELQPLGTAGGVKNCADFLENDDFLVISGDCLCSFDLKELISRHKAAGALATIALTSFPTPTEYGLVVTREDGLIEKFIEKPSYDAVVTDLINTGVYVFSPEALNLIPENTAYDFGRDFFPAALDKNAPLYGFLCDGYWCDIGSPEAYIKANLDALDGKTGINLGRHTGGVYANSPIPDYCDILPPCYIGKNVKLDAGAKIGPYAVLGGHTRIGEGAGIRSSVCDGGEIGKRAQVFGSFLSAGSVVGDGASVEKGCTFGSGVKIGKNAKIYENVTISDSISVPDDSEVKSSLSSAPEADAPLFSAAGEITLSEKADGKPDSLLRFGLALSSFGKIGISFSSGSAASAAADILSGGVRSGGGNVYILSSSFPAAAAFAAPFYGLDASVFIKEEDSGDLRLAFYDKFSLPFSRLQQRKIEYPSPIKKTVSGEKVYLSGVGESYGLFCLKNFGGENARGFKVSTPGKGAENRVLRKILSDAGFDIVSAQKGVPAFSVSSGGGLTASDENGNQLSEETSLLCALLCLMEDGVRRLALTKNTPAALKYLADSFECTLLNTEKDRVSAGTAYAKYPYEGIFLSSVICAYMSKHAISLSEIAEKVPQYYTFTKEIPINGGAAAFLRKIRTQAFSEAAMEFDSGLKIITGTSFASLTPSYDGGSVTVKAESAQEIDAKEMMSSIENFAESIK